MDQLDPDNGKLVVTPGRKASGLVKGSGVTEGAEVQVNVQPPPALYKNKLSAPGSWHLV